MDLAVSIVFLSILYRQEGYTKRRKKFGLMYMFWNCCHTGRTVRCISFLNAAVMKCPGFFGAGRDFKVSVLDVVYLLLLIFWGISNALVAGFYVVALGKRPLVPTGNPARVMPLMPTNVVQMGPHG